MTDTAIATLPTTTSGIRREIDFDTPLNLMKIKSSLDQIKNSDCKIQIKHRFIICDRKRNILFFNNIRNLISKDKNSFRLINGNIFFSNYNLPTEELNLESYGFHTTVLAQIKIINYFKTLLKDSSISVGIIDFDNINKSEVNFIENIIENTDSDKIKTTHIIHFNYFACLIFRDDLTGEFFDLEEFKETAIELYKDSGPVNDSSLIHLIGKNDIEILLKSSNSPFSPEDDQFLRDFVLSDSDKESTFSKYFNFAINNPTPSY